MEEININVDRVYVELVAGTTTGEVEAIRAFSGDLRVVIRAPFDTALVGQQGLQVIPMRDWERHGQDCSELVLATPHLVKGKDGTYCFPTTGYEREKGFNHSRMVLHDIKFPYKITVNAEITTGYFKWHDQVNIQGPSVAPVYFALVKAIKGLNIGDMVPRGKAGAPAGFSYNLVNNEDELMAVYGRMVELAKGYQDPYVFNEVTDGYDIVEAYRVSTSKHKNLTEDRSPLTPEYKDFVAKEVNAGVSRLFATEGDTKAVLKDMYQNVWRKGMTDEAVAKDPMYTGLLDVKAPVAGDGGRVPSGK
ncbi:MAG: hypothetical protein FWE53_04035 [Firmicutes bacterium]|nr:hypothetical protein [Bacillota bacterium]